MRRNFIVCGVLIVAAFIVAGCAAPPAPKPLPPRGLSELDGAVQRQWKHQDKALDVIERPGGLVETLERLQGKVK